MVFIGKVLLGFQTSPSTFPFLFFTSFFCKFWFFLFFCIFKSEQISTSTQCGKSMILKNEAWKVERVPNVFENLNSFETMLKMLKTIQMYKKCIFWIFNFFSLFLDFSMFFRYFWIFLKIYQNMGQKLGSNNNIGKILVKCGWNYRIIWLHEAMRVLIQIFSFW